VQFLIIDGKNCNFVMN